MTIFRWFRRVRCEHGRETLTNYEVLGVTLGWSAEPEVNRRWTWLCQDCGRLRASQGYLPRAVCLMEFKRDERGWPLNSDGSKMSINHG